MQYWQFTPQHSRSEAESQCCSHHNMWLMRLERRRRKKGFAHSSFFRARGEIIRARNTKGQTNAPTKGKKGKKKSSEYHYGNICGRYSLFLQQSDRERERERGNPWAASSQSAPNKIYLPHTLAGWLGLSNRNTHTGFTLRCSRSLPFFRFASVSRCFANSNTVSFFQWTVFLFC